MLPSDSEESEFWNWFEKEKGSSSLLIMMPGLPMWEQFLYLNENYFFCLLSANKVQQNWEIYLSWKVQEMGNNKAIFSCYPSKMEGNFLYAEFDT